MVIIDQKFAPGFPSFESTRRACELAAHYECGIRIRLWDSISGVCWPTDNPHVVYKMFEIDMKHWMEANA